MCTFITVFLPDTLAYDTAAAVFTRSGRRLVAQVSPSLQAAVGPGWQPWLSAAHCDCGTALASARAEPAWKDDAGRWRKKGWSEAKIARARAEQLAHAQQAQQARHREGLLDAGQWLQRIDALLQAGAVRVGLLVRDYEGALDAGLPAPPQQRWPRAQLAAADLLAFAPGTLHWIDRD